MEIKRDLNEHVSPQMMIYSMSTLIDRALPDVDDGMKPIHRRILYSADHAKYYFKGEFAKTANLISETMKIHGHGDSSIEGAIALLTDKNETLLHPYLAGKGSFGKVYSTDKWSAPRYTFCKLNPFSEELLLEGVDKGMIKFISEGQHFQPLKLPVKFPNILVKPNKGIAVGMATNIPSFNLKEVNELTSKIIKGEEFVDELIPDFSSGGEYIYNKEEIKKIFYTGCGSIVVRSKWKFNEKDSCIEVYEIPYSTTANAIIEKITSLIKTGKLKDVLDVRDETGYDKSVKEERLKITIDIRKKSDPDIIMAKLFNSTSLQDTFSVNMNMLVNGVPKVLGVKDTIDTWIQFRKDIVKKELNIDIEKLRKEYLMLSDLIKITDVIDAVIKTVKKSETEEEVVFNLMKDFKLSVEGATYISQIKLVKLNKSWIQNKTKRFEDVVAKGKELGSILKDDTKICDIICEQLSEINRKYGKDRLTTVISPCEIKQIKEVAKQIENYNCYVTVTDFGYIRKSKLSGESGKLKDGDSVIYNEPTTNASNLHIFTNLGNCYMIKISSLELQSTTVLGGYIPNIVSMEKDERIIYIAVSETYDGNMLFGFSNGKMAKVPMSSYKTSYTKTVKAFNMTSDLVFISIEIEDCNLMAKSSINKIMEFSTKDINPKASRVTQGVAVQKQKNDSSTVGYYWVQPLEDQYYKSSLNSIGKYIRKEDEEFMEKVLTKV